MTRRQWSVCCLLVGLSACASTPTAVEKDRHTTAHAAPMLAALPGDDTLGPPTVLLFEVAPVHVRCKLPMLPEYAPCPSVRTVVMDANSRARPTEAWWGMPYGIRGYQHVEGRHDLLRVIRRPLAQPPIHGASAVWILDRTLESEAASP